MSHINPKIVSKGRRTVSLKNIPDRKTVVVNVMGATGSGKTTFINKASGGSLKVGMKLESCTSNIALSPTFSVDGYQVTLIDTPGFDDTSRSDMDILETITDFLAKQYEHGKKLAGVLYFHRISDIRMGGISRRNFRVFRELCGEDTLKNVVIVTNMWGSVAQDVAEAREVELMNNEAFFKSALDKGAQIVRHDDTPEMAREILRRLVEKKPIPLRIQLEMVEEGRDLSQTASAEELDSKINTEIVKHRKAVKGLRKTMEGKVLFAQAFISVRPLPIDALRSQDEASQEKLEEQRKQIQAEMDTVFAGNQRLACQFTAEQDLLQNKLEEVKRDATAQAGTDVNSLTLFSKGCARRKRPCEMIATSYDDN
ncbi:hypothetical protein VNI00_013249 [Paramarasmius palmivorus]|uniref:G domain-containing protein n=1 Tax=Paramarasmius palmivorus TaxID=297713 RepID=A0AAW0C058_9AGAR